MKKTLLLAAVVALAAAAFSVPASASPPPRDQVVATSHAGAAAADVGSIPAADPKETMSYSFTVKAATKAAALAAASAAFDSQVLVSQPVHKVDREAALKNAEAHVNLIADPKEGEEVALSMHGSIGGEIDWSAGEVKRLSSAGSGCTAYLALVSTT